MGTLFLTHLGELLDLLLNAHLQPEPATPG
jgi:hypothetical protein